MSLWTKNTKGYIRSGWAFWKPIGGAYNLIERATDNLPCTIDIEHKGDVFVRLENGLRVKADKRAVQVL